MGLVLNFGWFKDHSHARKFAILHGAQLQTWQWAELPPTTPATISKDIVE